MQVEWSSTLTVNNCSQLKHHQEEQLKPGLLREAELPTGLCRLSAVCFRQAALTDGHGAYLHCCLCFSVRKVVLGAEEGWSRHSCRGR